MKVSFSEIRIKDLLRNNKEKKRCQRTSTSHSELACVFRNLYAKNLFAIFFSFKLFYNFECISFSNRTIESKHDFIEVFVFNYFR